MSILSIIPEKFRATPEVKQARRQVCKNCPHFKKLTGSCGTIFFGGWVFHNGQQKELCGCIVDEKTELKNEKCPLGKW